MSYEPEEEPNGFEVRTWKKNPSKKQPEEAKAKRSSWRNAPAFAVFTVVIAFMVLMGIFHLSEWASDHLFTIRTESTTLNLK